MSDEGAPNSLEARKAAEKARLLEQFERDWADAQRLAAKYPSLFAISLEQNHARQQSEQTKVAADPTSPEPPKNELQSFDGTVRGLINSYQSDPDSGYQKIRYRTRENYDNLLRRIERDIGAELVT